jgi:hypothetical protein
MKGLCTLHILDVLSPDINDQNIYCKLGLCDYSVSKR